MEHYWLLITILYTCLHSQIRDSPNSLKKRKKLKAQFGNFKNKVHKERILQLSFAGEAYHIYYRD